MEDWLFVTILGEPFFFKIIYTSENLGVFSSRLCQNAEGAGRSLAVAWDPAHDAAGPCVSKDPSFLWHLCE